MQAMVRLPKSSVWAIRSARTGTAISAAALGVGARRSETKSIRVVSVSWPTAEISGMVEAAAARTTISSLKAHRSSRLPPPRATISTSGRGTGPSLGQAVEARDGGGHLARRLLALHRHRPDQHMAREAVGQPMQDVADHRAAGRGHHAHHLGQEGQRPLAVGVEQALGLQLLAPVLQELQQRAFARQLQAVDDDLVARRAGIGRELAGGDDLHALLDLEAEARASCPSSTRASRTAFSSFRRK